MAIQRAQRSLSEDLPPVRLYLDDVEKIIEVLGDAGEMVTLQTPEYRLDSVADFAELPAVAIHELSIQSQEPYVTLELRPYSVTLYSSGKDPASKAAFHEIAEILKGRPPLFPALRRSMLLSGFIAGAGIVLASPLGKAGFEVEWILIGATILVIGAILMWHAYVNSVARYSTVVLVRRRKDISFMARKKDDLLLIIISALLGSLLTLLVGRLL